MPKAGWLPLHCALTALLVLTGCAGPGTRVYVLTPLGGPAAAPAPSVERTRAIGLYPVRLPAYLDRPEIVTRIEPNRLHLAESDQWGEPFGEGVTRVLAWDLALLLPTHRIAVFPQEVTGIPEYTVFVEVVQLDAALHQDCTLVARWTVRGMGDTESRTGTFIRTEPVGDSYGTFVAAVSRLIEGLAQGIAADMRGLAP